MGRRDEAEIAFRKAVKFQETWVDKSGGSNRNANSSLADALYEYGEFLDNARRPEEAAAAFRRSIALYENLAAEYPGLTRIKVAVTRYCSLCPAPQFRDEARAILLARQLLREKPAVAEFWSLLGIAHHRRGETQAAVEAFGNAIGLDPNEAYARFFVAMSHWKQGEKDQARSEYEKAVRTFETHHAADVNARRFRTEAAALLGLKPPGEEAKPKSSPESTSPPE